MKAVQRTFAILACLFLTVQTVRHCYLLLLAPRTSALAKYDEPLVGEIGEATSLDELLRRYDAPHREADRIRADHRAAQSADPNARFDEWNAEPFKSERLLLEAITTWEARSREIRALRFYWLVGFVFAALGLACYQRWNRWLGVTLLIVGFSEMIYWTTPELMSLMPGGAHEYDRLLANKLAFSVASLVMLGLAMILLEMFNEERNETWRIGAAEQAAAADERRRTTS